MTSNCACASAQEPSLNGCSPRKEASPCRTVTRREPACKDAFVCSKKLCKMYGFDYTIDGEDENVPCFQPPFKPTPYRSKNELILGLPCGLVKSTAGVSAKAKETKAEVASQRFAYCLIGFARMYLTSDDKWNTAMLDTLLKDGQKLIADSKQNSPPTPEFENPPNLYCDTELKVLRSFILDGYTFQVELNEALQLQKSASKGATTEPLVTDHPISILKLGLQTFFRKAKYCLVKLSNWYVLVWRSHGGYFVLDLNGRRPEDFITNKDKGVGMLLYLKELNNVVRLVSKLSGFSASETFQLREMKVTRLVDADGKVIARETGKRINEYEIISTDYAVLRANLHLTLNTADLMRSRSALPVGVATLLTAKIDHPATWNRKVLDRIICYGVNVCRCYWQECTRDPDAGVDIRHFPDELQIGQYYATYKLQTRQFEGLWQSIPKLSQSELGNALKKCMDTEGPKLNNLLVQVNQQIYTVWKKGNIIYLFDPYRHRINWTGSNAGDGGESSVLSPTLRLFHSFELFIGIFHQVLMESNTTTKFYIHPLETIRLWPVRKGEAGDRKSPVCAVPPPYLANQEYQYDTGSLNEGVCFAEDEAKCKDLGEISDFEPEDARDDALSLGPPTESETESEHAAEEEGEEEGMLSDLGGSSTDDSGRRRRRRKKGDGGDETENDDDDDDDGGRGKKKGKKGGKGGDGDDKDKDKSGKKKGKKGGGADDASGSRRSQSNSSRKSKTDGKDGGKDGKDGGKDGKGLGAGGKDGKGLGAGGKDGKDLGAGGKDGKDGKGLGGAGGKDGKGLGGAGGKDGKGGAGAKDGKGGAGGKGGVGGDGYGDDDDDASKTGKGAGGDGDDSECGDMHGAGNFTCKPNRYPGYCHTARDLAVIGSESGTYESICKLLRAGFKCSDRVMAMMPWGNYVVFRSYDLYRKTYFLFDGCTCNVNRFRHMDLSCGTAGLLCLQSMNDVISYIIDSRLISSCLKRRSNRVNEICKEYCV